MIDVHFILYVRDQGRSRGFYEAVLGDTPHLDVPGMTQFVLPGGVLLGLMPEAGIERLLPSLDTGTSATARAELYLLCDDLDAAVERARSAGAELLSEASERSWGDRVAYLRDLDGHVLALASAVSR